MGSFVAAVAPALPPAEAGRVLAAASRASGALRTAVLRGLAGAAVTAPDAATVAALTSLLENGETRAAALLVAGKWDRAGAMQAATAAAAQQVLAELEAPGVPDARRGELASALLALPTQRAAAVARIAATLKSPATTEAARAPLLAALGELPPADVNATFVDAFVATKSAAVFEQSMKRPESARALLAAVKSGRLTAADLGPANVDRLRTHPVRGVANEAATVLAAGTKSAKDDVIAQLLPEVQKPGGNVANGKMLFVAACSACHKFGDLGLRDVGPPLAGIGAHPVAELLAHIVDPNRQVEPNFTQWNVTTKKGETFVGVLASENNAAIVLRNQGGDTELRKEDIATRENTRRSLMPEGFEGFGAAGLRDMIAYMQSEAKADGAPARKTGSAAPAAEAPTKAGKAGKGGKAGKNAPAPAAPAAPDPSGAEGPKEGGRGDAPLPPVGTIQWEPGKPRVLIITGGSSHKFTEIFGVGNSAFLRAAGFSVCVTEDRDQAAAELAGADVAVISVNRRFFDTPAYRKAVMDFAAKGKGLVMLHPGTWYAFANWPELNARIVGGGSRGHDRIAKFSVNAVKPDHPVMRGVPARFEVEDELYYMNAEPEKIPPGTAAIEVLAETSPSVRFQKPHPAVWTTQHPAARIVGITIGHDERTHDLPAYRTLLTNAVGWAARK